MRLNSKPCGLPHFAVKLTTKFTGIRARDYGIYLAEFQVGASLSPSHARDKLREEAQAGNEEVS